MTCSICGQEMTVYEPGQVQHPSCGPVPVGVTFAEPAGSLEGEAALIKRELTDVILFADATSERSQQLAVGPSELGDPCDRRLGYRLAGFDAINNTDPWPAIVGTAVHSWLEAAVTSYNAFTGTANYLTELTVHPNDLVIGHSDLYDVRREMVIDWKTVNTKNMAKFREEGPSDSYITQVNLYGLGQIRAGRPVKKVCLVCLPRAGWLGDAWVWVDDYDENIALEALDRMYALGATLLDLDVLNNPYRWAQVPATPSRLCGWCPFYRQGSLPDGKGADDDGCPGW
jgi:hypothetical protein